MNMRAVGAHIPDFKTFFVKDEKSKMLWKMAKKRPNVAEKSSEFTFSYFWDFGYIGSYVVYHKQNISHRLYPSTAILEMVVKKTHMISERVY